MSAAPAGVYANHALALLRIEEPAVSGVGHDHHFLRTITALYGHPCRKLAACLLVGAEYAADGRFADELDENLRDGNAIALAVGDAASHNAIANGLHLVLPGDGGGNDVDVGGDYEVLLLAGLGRGKKDFVASRMLLDDAPDATLLKIVLHRVHCAIDLRDVGGCARNRHKFAEEFHIRSPRHHHGANCDREHHFLQHC